VTAARAPSDVRCLEWSGRDDFGRVRAEWLEAVRWDAKLLPIAKLVIQEIAAKFGHDRSDAWPSIPYLAAALDTSEPTVKRAIASAIERGVLVCEKRGFGGANHYFMAASRQVQNEVMADYERRMIHFGETRRPSMRSPMIPMVDAANEITGDPSMRSPMIPHSDHPRSLNEITGDPLSLSSTPTSEPLHRSLTEGLGDTEQEEALRESIFPSKSQTPALLADDKPELSPRELLIRELGDGDVRDGRLIADAIGPARCAYLMQMIEDVGAWRAGPQIRDAVADARERLLPSFSQPEVKP